MHTITVSTMMSQEEALPHHVLTRSAKRRKR
jgi:hypothetical protein